MSVAERASELLDAGGFPDRLRKKQLARTLECDPGYVTKLLARGAIPQDAVDGLWVDVRQALQGIVRASDPSRVQVAPAEAPLLDQRPSAKVLPKDDSFAAIKSRKELALAQRQEMELAERAGQLVEKAAVARAIEDHVRSVTQGLMQIGARVSEQLAAESDPNRCRQVVDHAIKAELENLSRGMHDYVDGLES